MENSLELRQIYKTYGAGNKKKLALQAINFTLEAGKCWGLVGISGCGKSTLLKMMARLENADNGEVYWQGKNITLWQGKKLRPFYDDLRIIQQNAIAAFNPRKTIGWSIGERLLMHGYTESKVASRVREVLSMVKLSVQCQNRYPHEMSGGECQRAAIARALILKPKILLCDEVTSSLDKANQVLINSLLRKLVVQQNISCLFVTHNLNTITSIADKVAVMDAGKIVECAAMNSIIKNPQSAVARALVTAAHILK